jgi:hypothetical protein
MGMTPNTTNIMINVRLFPMCASPTTALLKTSYSSGAFELLVGSTWASAASATHTSASSPTGASLNIAGFSGLQVAAPAIFNTSANIVSLDARF